MSQEILNSAIMQLRAKALEAYGIIKDTYRQPSKEGDADRIAALSLKLAQLEGGMLTLQQYAPEIIAAVAVPAPAIEYPAKGYALGFVDQDEPFHS